MYYGPDTYMGRNLASMLRALADLPDEVQPKRFEEQLQGGKLC